MKLMTKTKLLSILLLSLFAFSITFVNTPQVLAQGDGDNPRGPPEGAGPPEGTKPNMERHQNRVRITYGNFEIELTGAGEVPFYHFNTSEGRFFFKFMRIVEFEDQNDNDVYDSGEAVGAQIPLPSASWDITIEEDTDASKQFTFQTELDGAAIKLVNYFKGDSPALKFDVIIENWSFNESSTGLALEWQLIAQTQRQMESQANGTSIELRSNDELFAYLDIVSDIEVDNELVTDGAILNDVSTGNNSRLDVYINYPKFNESLVHDPVFGTTWQAVGTQSATINPFQNLDGSVKAGFLGFMTLITLVLAGVLIRQRRES